MADQENEIEIESLDGTSGSKKEKLSYRNICLKQYQVCIEQGSKEMTLGGLRKRIINGDEVITEIVDNQIELFNNSVEMLRILMIPFLKLNNPEFPDKIKDFKKELEAIRKKKVTALVEIRGQVNKRSSRRPPSNDMAEDGTGLSERDKVMPLARSERERHIKIFEQNRFLLFKGLLETLVTVLDKKNYFDDQGDTSD